MQLGVDIGGLTEEMTLVAESILDLAEEDERALSCASMRLLMRVIGRGTAASVSAYAAVRDAELAHQAAQHFSFVAHEIRNPLQTAQLAANLLRSGAEKERGKYGERLRRALLQLSDLVDNSLVQARLYGAPQMRLTPLNGRELVQEVCEDMAVHADRRRVDIATELEDFELEGDRKLLVSALTNLPKYAVKFTREESCITVRARADEQRALFEVEDQCGGMRRSYPSASFNRSFRKTRTRAALVWG